MGEPVDASSVLAKVTIAGDTNVDNMVDLDDYASVDATALAGFSAATGAGGWRRGDFDYDGLLTADDYWMMDRAFLMQRGFLPLPLAAISSAPVDEVGFEGVVTATVPEPGVALLSVLLPPTLFGRRRRAHASMQGSRRFDCPRCAL